MKYTLKGSLHMGKIARLGVHKKTPGEMEAVRQWGKRDSSLKFTVCVGVCMSLQTPAPFCSDGSQRDTGSAADH